MDRIKYPRTMNLPWSGSDSSDDVWWKDTNLFQDKEVVVKEKMDGECTSIYPDSHIHARSIDTRHHPSRSHVKALAAEISYKMNPNHRICGENVTAFHSIYYTELPAFFLAFGLYDNDMCLSWDEFEDVCDVLGVKTVPVIYRGMWDEQKIKDLWTGESAFPVFDSPSGFTCDGEGYVVRNVEAFPHAEFRNNCAKYVRPHHVQTSSHWMSEDMVFNELILEAHS